ncbi:MAG: hypothetical protein HY644_08430 [Acidobacteria bacterium]|nr:hypothetical protein [Acidobacteriota bacterium]
MRGSVLAEEQKSLLVELKHAGIVMFGQAIKAKYGLGPPIYLDLRENLYQRADLLWRIGGEFARKIRESASSCEFAQGVIGVPDTATPLALTTALYAWQEGIVPPLHYVHLRQDGKSYGSAGPSYVIGKKSADLEYNLIDDVIASGLSKWRAIEKLRNDGITVRRIIVFFDRQQGGTEALAREGYRVDSIFKVRDVIDFYLDQALIDHVEHRSICDFLRTHYFERPLWTSR